MPSYTKRTYPSGKTTWQFYISRQESPIKKQIKGCGYNTQREAIEACKKKLNELEKLNFADNPNILFKDGCGIYFKRKNLANTTREKYEIFLKQHINPYFENDVISSIKPLKIDAWFDSLQEKGATISTINESLKICKAICNFLVAKEVIIKNPFKTKEPLEQQEENTEVKFFTPFEAVQMFKKAKEDFSKQFYMILKFAFYTGAREGEILGFDVKYFDHKNNKIEIRQQFTNGQLTPKLKNKVSRRDIYIDAHFSNELNSYIVENNITGLLFTNSVGRAINNDNMNFRWWKPLLKSLNFDTTMHFHYIRHSYASIRLSAGDHYMDVSQSMGHASPIVTLKVYGHFIPDMKKQVVNMNEKFCEHIVSIEENEKNKRGLKPSCINGGR